METIQKQNKQIISMTKPGFEPRTSVWQSGMETIYRVVINAKGSAFIVDIAMFLFSPKGF